MTRSETLAVARAYLKAVESGTTAELRRHLTTDFVQREWPNPMSPEGASRNLPEVLQVSDRVEVLRLGRRVVTYQKGEADVEMLVGAMTGALDEVHS